MWLRTSWDFRFLLPHGFLFFFLDPYFCVPHWFNLSLGLDLPGLQCYMFSTKPSQIYLENCIFIENYKTLNDCMDGWHQKDTTSCPQLVPSLTLTVQLVWCGQLSFIKLFRQMIVIAQGQVWYITWWTSTWHLAPHFFVCVSTYMSSLILVAKCKTIIIPFSWIETCHKSWSQFSDFMKLV
jgi:hypothetical protein